MEDACLRLVDLLRPFDSSFVRRQPLPLEKAEQLQRSVARMRSCLSMAAWDLGLQKTHQDARREAVSLVATMRENIRQLLHPHGQDGAPKDLVEYLENLARELDRTLNEIDRTVGGTPSGAAAAS
jgi:hypothetical protein